MVLISGDTPSIFTPYFAAGSVSVDGDDAVLPIEVAPVVVVEVLVEGFAVLGAQVVLSR